MFKRPSPKEPLREAEELKQLLAVARQEGEKLLILSNRLVEQGAEIKALTKNSARLEQAVTGATAKLEGLEARFARVETAAKSVAELDNLVQVLVANVKEATLTADRLLAPDGELQKQRQTAQQLSAHALQTRASLDALRSDQERLDKLRTDVTQALEEAQKARSQLAGSTTEVGVLRTAVTELTKEQQAIRETARESRDDSAAASARVYEVEQKLTSLGRLQDLARTLDDRINSLNATVEHVMQRSKVLEQQKHTIERAIIDGHRLGGMLTAMESQIARLEEGRRQAAVVEDTVDRIEALVRESGHKLDEAGRKRDSMVADLDRLDRERTSLVEFVGKYEDRMAAERREIDASQARVAAVEASLQRLERTQEAVAVRDKELGAMAERLAGLEAQLTTAIDRADEAGRKIEIVEVLKQDLLRVDEMARRATWQMESLKSARADLEELRAEVQTFYREHAEAAQLRDRLTADRVALEGFLDRASAFAVTLPELDARLNSVRAKLATVDEGTQKAANLVAIADDLDRHMTRLTGYQQFVGSIESRLNALQNLTAEVDRKIEDQIGRRGEIETLRSLCDGVSVQVTDIRQKLGSLSQTQAKLVPLAEQVTSLRQEVTAAEARFASALRDQAEIAEQERRIADMQRAVGDLTDLAETRLTQVQALSDSLSRSETIKDKLMQELSVVQGRQREVAGQLEAADAQGRQLDATLRQLEDRRHQLAFAEKRMSSFEESVAELRSSADAIELRLQDLTKRQEVLDALRKEVEGVREVSAQSKADLEHLQSHRAEVLSLRAQVDELLAVSRSTEERLVEIQARRRVIDEVQLKVNVITSMLDDVRLSLETVGAQRAVIDHALADLARFEGVVQDAERTLKSLQNERQLAEHIERSIQTLRARTSVSEDKKRA